MTDKERKIDKSKNPREIMEIIIQLEFYKRALENMEKPKMKWEIFRKP